MKSGKLKIITASLMLCLMFCVSILSGCSLVTTDYSQYYKAIVASTTTEKGKKIEITKKDLIIAYRSYGYQYSSYYGMSVEEAIELTLEQLISTQLIIEKVENYSKAKNNGEVLNTLEKKYLWEKTYDSVISNLDSLLSTSDDDDDDGEGSAVEKQSYDKTVELSLNDKTGEYEIVKKEKPKTTLESYTFWSEGNKDASTEAGREEIYNLVGDFVVNNSKYASAYSKYISQLKSSEKGQNLSTVNKEVMLREIENLYESNYESYLVTRYEEIFKYDGTNVTVEDILSLYRKELLDDYATYELEGTSNFSEEIVKSADGMYYVPDDGKEFFYVTHILLKFDDGQTALLEEYNATLEGEGSGEYTVKQAKQGIEELYRGLLATVRVDEDEDGKYEVSDTLSKKSANANDVLREVKNATSEGSELEKAEKFYDLMVKYTEDDGTISSKYNYVIGVDYSTPTLDEDGNQTKSYTAYTQMVEGFTDGAIELYNHGNAKIGDISGLVRSEYGIHILMYGGKVENLCDNIGLKMTISNDVIVKLYETRINPCVDYTYFDMFYDELVSDNFSTYKSNDIILMKSKIADYNFYKNAYKDLI